MTAQLTVFLARVSHPLGQAVLVDPFDAARADARMEQLSIGRSFASTNATNVALREIVHVGLLNNQI